MECASHAINGNPLCKSPDSNFAGFLYKYLLGCILAHSKNHQNQEKTTHRFPQSKKTPAFSVCLSNCYLIVADQLGERISAFLSLRLSAVLPFTKPGDATHILFVLHEQTDCKLADNFCTDNVIYGCQAFVFSVCFIQI